MKNLSIILIIGILIVISQLTAVEYQLPKVLFLSTGDGDGRGTISDGLVIANEEFAKLGAIIRIDNRKILQDPKKMQKYSIIIAPTIYGYHDGDRLYSLSYLTESEMQNLSTWVKNGGTLVSDVYLGRNKLDGQDRINTSGEFNKSNWDLAECFGVEMKEMNMRGYSIISDKIWSDTIVSAFTKDEWTPVVTKLTSSKIKTLAEWNGQNKTFPALTVNTYNKGKAVLLGNFSIIHPAIDNGFSSSKEIADFYKYIYDLSINNANNHLKPNVWEKGAGSALGLSFNANGNLEQYQKILKLLKDENLSATFFINAATGVEIIKKIKENDKNEIASNSNRRVDYRTLNYAKTMNEILASKNITDSHVDGFRFPFTNNSFWGMLSLQELGFNYDSSIGLNHIEYYRGSVYPYNIPIFKDNYYQTLDVLEVSQNLHDDWFYLKVLDTKNYTANQLKIEIEKYDAYLESLWIRAIKPNRGLMTIIAHPAYTGFNESTLQVLKNAITRAKNDDAWITSLNTIADRWNQLYDLNIHVKDEKELVEITFLQGERSIIKNLSFTLDVKPENVKFEKKYSIRQKDDKFILNLSEVTHLDKLQLMYK